MKSIQLANESTSSRQLNDRVNSIDTGFNSHETDEDVMDTSDNHDASENVGIGIL